jgi:hypothetical protein
MTFNRKGFTVISGGLSVDNKTVSDFDKVTVSKMSVLSGLTSALMFVEMERLRYAAAQRAPTEKDVKEIMDQAASYISRVLEKHGIKVTEETVQ